MQMMQNLALGLTLSIVATSTAVGEEAESYRDELTALTLGSFTSVEQSSRDPRYGVVESEIVRIWPDRDDGVWFYQEQAYLGDTIDEVDQSAKDKPYFARVTHSVEIEPGVVQRTPHRIKNADTVRGAWRKDVPLAGLSPDDLEPGTCALMVKRIAEKYWASQSERCPNAHRGASYAISLGVITPGTYANWDRGFTADDEHVWGPASGGYVFKRKQD